MDEQEANAARSQEPQESEPLENIEQTPEKGDTNSPGDERNAQEGRVGDALGWLEGPAFTAPIEEMPTLQWPEIPPSDEKTEKKRNGSESILDVSEGDVETVESLESLDVTEDWLEQLASGQETTVDEMPTLVTNRESGEGSSSYDPIEQHMEQIDETAVTAQLDSDPMAWLEQLAIEQNYPLEELPSVADRVLALEIASQIEAGQGVEPELAAQASQALEIDEALSYLEQLAVAQGISLDDVSFDHVESIGSLDDALNILDQMTVRDVPAPILAAGMATVEDEVRDWNDLSGQIPDDPDEALAWLGKLAEEDTSSEMDLDEAIYTQNGTKEASAESLKASDVVSVGDQLELELDAEESALDIEFLEQMPDDPDEAMIWMEGLAGQQGGPTSARSEPTTDRQQAESEDFVRARAALLSGNVAAATQTYRDILDKGQGGNALVTELETAVDSQPDEPELLNVLGDAYMQNGQLQKALKTYRKGFDHL